MRLDEDFHVHLATPLAAVKRKYESVRRLWLAEGKDDFEQTSMMESIKKKNRQRRQRVCIDYG